MEPDGGPETDSVGTGGQRSYQAYLLRLWQDHRDGQPLWRASLENPHTGQRLGFADLSQLFAFIQGQASSQPPAGSLGLNEK